MGCNCIPEIEEEIKMANHAAEATLGSLSNQNSEVSYRPITAQGRPSKHKRYTRVAWIFCPFCREKI
ncbi:hypothetical protein ES703_93930 [subsurface metagenome]